MNSTFLHKPISTISYSCGFIFVRKGPEQSSEDRLRIGRVIWTRMARKTGGIS